MLWREVKGPEHAPGNFAPHVSDRALTKTAVVLPRTARPSPYSAPSLLVRATIGVPSASCHVHAPTDPTREPALGLRVSVLPPPQVADSNQREHGEQLPSHHWQPSIPDHIPGWSLACVDVAPPLAPVE